MVLGATAEGLRLCSCSRLFHPSQGNRPSGIADVLQVPWVAGAPEQIKLSQVTFMLLLILFSSCLQPRFHLYLRVHWWITGMCFQSYCYLKTLAWHSHCVRHCCKHFANVVILSLQETYMPSAEVLLSSVYSQGHGPVPPITALPHQVQCGLTCWKHQHRVGIRQQPPWGQKGRPLTAHQLLNQTLFSPGDPYGWPSSKPLIQSIFFISREMI